MALLQLDRRASERYLVSSNLIVVFVLCKHLLLCRYSNLASSGKLLALRCSLIYVPYLATRSTDCYDLLHELPTELCTFLGYALNIRLRE